MLEKARERAARKASATSGCCRWTPPTCKFADDSFDIVYAPYLISVVPDPVTVAQEMGRVCRPGGRIIFLNHFLSPNPILSRIERLISPATIHIGFKSDLDLPAFLAQADLQAGVDRKGELAADLVAGDLHQVRSRLTRFVGELSTGRFRDATGYQSVSVRRDSPARATAA